MNDLYRENLDAYDNHPGLPDVFRNLVKAGVLIPVETGEQFAIDRTVKTIDFDGMTMLAIPVVADLKKQGVLVPCRVGGGCHRCPEMHGKWQCVLVVGHAGLHDTGYDDDHPLLDGDT